MTHITEPPASTSEPYHDVPAGDGQHEPTRLSYVDPSEQAGDDRYEFFQVVQGYLDRACRLLEMPDYIARVLSQPKNELTRGDVAGLQSHGACREQFRV